MDDKRIILSGASRAQTDGLWLGDGTYHLIEDPVGEEIATPQQVASTPTTPDDDRIEICRSFGFKLSLQHYGGKQYESADFFCSRKMACHPESQHMLSETLFEDCLTDVQNSIAGFIQTLKQRAARRVA